MEYGTYTQEKKKEKTMHFYSCHILLICLIASETNKPVNEWPKVL